VASASSNLMRLTAFSHSDSFLRRSGSLGATLAACGRHTRARQGVNTETRSVGRCTPVFWEDRFKQCRCLLTAAAAAAAQLAHCTLLPTAAWPCPWRKQHLLLLLLLLLLLVVAATACPGCSQGAQLLTVRKSLSASLNLPRAKLASPRR
jgi:hypothetical protein